MSDDIVEVLRRAARFIEDHYTGVFTDDLRADAKALRDHADWVPAIMVCLKVHDTPDSRRLLAALRGEPE